MSSVENKNPVWGSRGIKDFKDDRDWGTDTFVLRDDELSYALGSQGYTRKKLAAASGCIVQYVGNVAFFAGEYEERRRARRYMRWLLEQRHGAVKVGNVDEMDDVHTMTIPAESVGQLMGQKGHLLRKIEEETGSFLFMARDHTERERLFVCSHKKEFRLAAEKLIDQEVRDIMDDRGAYFDDRGGGGRGGRGRRDDSYDSYDRAPKRVQDRSRSRSRGRY